MLITATAVGLVLAAGTSPVWGTGLAIGGAFVGVGYAIAQAAGINDLIDNKFGTPVNKNIELFMRLLDFLFNICYAPFRNIVKGGRLAAIMILSPSLTFFIMGIVIWLMSVAQLKYSIVSPLESSIISVALFALVFYRLVTLYVKDNRDAGKIRFPILHGLLIPFILIGSAVFYLFCLNEFG